jgi:Fe-Mn family superoxide dismutase
VVKDGKLAVGSTANQDSPLMGEQIAGISGIPILGPDRQAHACARRNGIFARKAGRP